MIRFGDRVFLHHESRWYMWESSWGMYRPVDGLRWTGSTMMLDDHAYCKDMTDPLYGYGDERIYNKCFHLTQEFSDIQNAEPVVFLTIGPAEWFRDRFVAMTPCAPRDMQSWKNMNLRRRTFRKHPRSAYTKRNIKYYNEG